MHQKFGLFIFNFSQFHQLQGDIEEEFGDGVIVVSLSFVAVDVIYGTYQRGDSIPGFTGFFEVIIDGELVHSKKVVHKNEFLLFYFRPHLTSRTVMGMLIHQTKWTRFSLL